MAPSYDYDNREWTYLETIVEETDDEINRCSAPIAHKPETRKISASPKGDEWAKKKRSNKTSPLANPAKWTEQDYRCQQVQLQAAAYQRVQAKKRQGPQQRQPQQKQSPLPLPPARLMPPAGLNFSHDPYGQDWAHGFSLYGARGGYGLTAPTPYDFHRTHEGHMAANTVPSTGPYYSQSRHGALYPGPIERSVPLNRFSGGPAPIEASLPFSSRDGPVKAAFGFWPKFEVSEDTNALEDPLGIVGSTPASPEFQATFERSPSCEAPCDSGVPPTRLAGPPTNLGHVIDQHMADSERNVLRFHI